MHPYARRLVLGAVIAIFAFALNVYAGLPATNLASHIIVCHPTVDPESLASEFHLSPRHVFRHALNGFSATIDPGTEARLKSDSRCSSVEADSRLVVCAQTNPTGILRMSITNFPVAHINGVDERIDVDVG